MIAGPPSCLLLSRRAASGLASGCCGVPISMHILSEGLPLLAVMVGFEKPVRLTRALLHASTEPLTRFNRSSGKTTNSVSLIRLPSHRSIPDNIQVATQHEGWRIVRDYVIEITILAVGAASRVRGGLPQFCFVAAWILFFDALLLFTLYITIICGKLEITRIRHHINLRKALEDDCVPRQAEDVSKLKLYMISGFVLFNVLQLSSLSFRVMGGLNAVLPLFRTSSLFTPGPINPFKVAANGLNDIYVTARVSSIETGVTVLPPIKYVMQSPVVPCGGRQDIQYMTLLLNDVLGSHVLGGILSSLEDPVVCKGVIVALGVSLFLNSYLMNAAHRNIRETKKSAETSIAIAKSAYKPSLQPNRPISKRIIEELELIVKEKKASLLDDEELVELCLRGKIPGYALETTVADQPIMTRLEAFTHAVKLRRAVVSRTRATMDVASGLENSKNPYQDLNNELVYGACCENVIRYLSLPVGVAGPILIDGQSYFIPMATTEGVLVASNNRGCKAIDPGNGAVTVINSDGMTRAPCIGFPFVSRAAEAKPWLDSEYGVEGPNHGV
ncbi:hypothetical protein EYZ11_003778 [Aspergillus tanneri]|uniref:SSD domain-containing protein n=1 Tax=Aspergillus tanneri TaxID=1220188 RepID=A0A4S3JMR7_9EURO|nr:hypothetical protein EYZ11_003778 [Aspergillus tanneri]